MALALVCVLKAKTLALAVKSKALLSSALVSQLLAFLTS